MARGIKDSVAILGMGCSKFGERWHDGPEDLLVEAFRECLEDAGIGRERIDAAWLATAIEEVSVGKSGIPLAEALRLPWIPVTRVENFCASGTESFRGAVYAVASGAADIALAAGVEKLKDTGYGGLPQRSRGALNDMVWANFSAPGSFAQLAAAYRAKHSVSPEDLKRAMAQVSVKSHANGAKNPKAHLRSEICIDKAVNAPMVADPLGLFDCCGVSDGAACAILCRPEIARELGREDPITVKALQVSVSNGSEAGHNSWDGSHFVTARIASRRAYDEAGVRDPRAEVDMVEAHDCFSITELVTMEDLGLSREGEGWRDVLDGVYDAEGDTPCQIDGGLKCFGHPIGASGLRMLYEVYLQLQGRAGERQLDAPRLGLTHNLGGAPHRQRVQRGDRRPRGRVVQQVGIAFQHLGSAPTLMCTWAQPSLVWLPGPPRCDPPESSLPVAHRRNTCAWSTARHAPSSDPNRTPIAFPRHTPDPQEGFPFSAWDRPAPASTATPSRAWCSACLRRPPPEYRPDSSTARASSPPRFFPRSHLPLPASCVLVRHARRPTQHRAARRHGIGENDTTP